jgi:hypothetical protein
MCIKTALLAATLAFSLSVHADTKPKKATPAIKTPKQTTPKPSKQGTIQNESFGLGAVAGSPGTTSGGATGKSTGGPPNLGGSGSKTDPCTLPNPPKSCKQSKPAH